MAATVKVTIIGMPQVRAMLKRLTPAESRKVVVDSLLECAHTIQRNAAEKQILPGGKGPPDPKQLTSRTGTLRGSIAVNRSPLPAAVEIGTHLVYGPVHELGGRHHPRRPFLAPAVEETEEGFPDVFLANWRRAAGV
jgi:phage gpG-like protein